MQVAATFEIANWDEQPFDVRDEAAKLTRASVAKNYAGDIIGTSVTEWLMAYNNDGTAEFVGIERISGSVGGRDGSLVLRHVGTFEDGAAKAELRIVSGTEDLGSAIGSGTMIADPNGRISLTIEPAPST